MLFQKLAKIRFLRSIVLPILKKFDITIVIFHDLTKRIFFLKLWSHKGYWFYGSKRESNEINIFKNLICNSSQVLEIGAHIGYLTQFFEYLVYPLGKVYVVEPSPNNRKFLKKNVKKSTLILPIALSNKLGEEKFFIDSYGGFTNSLKKDFTFSKNNELKMTQFTNNSKVSSIEVEVSTIDIICKKYKLQPDFIKIDVEGLELEVLQGGKEVLKSTKTLMVEISNNHEKIFNILEMHDFNPLDDAGNKVDWSAIKKEKLNKNFFFMK